MPLDPGFGALAAGRRVAVMVAVIVLAGAAVAVTVRQLGHRSSSHTGAGRSLACPPRLPARVRSHVVTASSLRSGAEHGVRLAGVQGLTVS